MRASSNGVVSGSQQNHRHDGPIRGKYDRSWTTTAPRGRLGPCRTCEAVRSREEPPFRWRHPRFPACIPHSGLLAQGQFNMPFSVNRLHLATARGAAWSFAASFVHEVASTNRGSANQGDIHRGSGVTPRGKQSRSRSRLAGSWRLAGQGSGWPQHFQPPCCLPVIHGGVLLVLRRRRGTRFRSGRVTLAKCTGRAAPGKHQRPIRSLASHLSPRISGPSESRR
jgi:hypothetical protein